MFKLQNQFKIISIYLFIFLGLLFTMNNNQVMAINNLNDENYINNEINKLYLERKELATKISYFLIHHLDDDVKLQKKLNDLDQIIKNLYQRIYDIKILKSINEQIWHDSYERNQIAIQILSISYQNPAIQELMTKYQKLVIKIKNLNQKYINLQYKLNEFN
ncbi:MULTISPECIES: SVM family protein [Candidatus Phytoplasma]|uniref:SVM family protein n=3 Tax=Candidatus Phytoplasma TaxID=33926 RepID=A0AAP4X8K9_9MOLU|nr:MULTISPECIES: SVM family protein [Phytoplasma]QLL36888.1 putative secreted protein, AYWB SAP42-like ['Echinacea purpurea' witches'-broom phytoplasma]WEX20457.1 MAG: putative secreted protein, SAP42-like [Candidatus Phytoplasma aurantifolia]EMR14767.1 putative effector, AYWB SAP42-like protein [Peanut witches'-broom phytoplasma NTU2011]MDO8052866.1 SVM family protein ['Vigna radiata' phytoplasma]MDO8054665.1 SVM family protein [Candidatus Phytoplasma australasiaticum]